MTLLTLADPTNVHRNLRSARDIIGRTLALCFPRNSDQAVIFVKCVLVGIAEYTHFYHKIVIEKECDYLLQPFIFYVLSLHNKSTIVKHLDIPYNRTASLRSKIELYAVCHFSQFILIFNLILSRQCDAMKAVVIWVLVVPQAEQMCETAHGAKISIQMFALIGI